MAFFKSYRSDVLDNASFDPHELSSPQVFLLSMLVFLANVLYSLVIVRKPAESNPWGSKSLEWQVPTPVPVHNFDRIPVFDADPYDYGVPPVAPAPAPAGASGVTPYPEKK